MDGPTLKDFLPGNLCVGCGECCKSLPGAYVPSDFGLDLNGGLRALLAEGRTTFDWLEGDCEWPETLLCIFYPRPAVVDHEGELLDGSKGGECTFLNENGCTLPRDKMPGECKALEPKSYKGGDCTTSELGNHPRYGIARLWRPYQSIIYDLIHDLIHERKGDRP